MVTFQITRQQLFGHSTPGIHYSVVLVSCEYQDLTQLLAFRAKVCYVCGSGAKITGTEGQFVNGKNSIFPPS